jgi:magnesium-transporting ATPase (P-type)
MRKTPDATDQTTTTKAQHAWHTIDRVAVESNLGTSAHGLSATEVQARQAQHGPNTLEEEAPPSDLLILLHQFTSPLIYILLIAAAITVILGHYIDAGVIAAVLLLNAVIGFTQERRAEQSVRALIRMAAPHARVIRDGREHEIESRELVPGDLVLLESGAKVPADLRLITATALSIDESLLTGESLPVTKRSEPLTGVVAVADRINLAYAGSIVASGRGRGYVIAIGANTELGAIASQVREEKQPETPLQQRMNRFARIVGVLVAISAVLVFAIGVVRGESPADMFLVAVTMAVAVVPEGLPVVFTITLAVGVRRMAQRNAIIRRLPAVETLGSTTTIGSDKTGTLTENRMTVRQIWAGNRFYTVEGDSLRSEAGLLDQSSDELATIPEHQALYLTLLTGVLTNEAEAYQQGQEFEIRGDPTEAALLIVAARLGLEPEVLRSEYPSYAEVPFESERQYSASVRERDGKQIIFVKGAPERVLGLCNRQFGESEPTNLNRDEILQAVRDMAAQGLRVLAMAYHPLASSLDDPEHVPEPHELIFLGLQGMLDPPRAGVREAIAGCHEAGMRVVMITGDHVATARAIGGQLGIASDGDAALTGAELEDMDDAALRARVLDVPIFARVTPEHKLRVVHALRFHGEVVAVTGDGVNDAPALRAADIGIAMGKSGTDVARESADMVLADDNFVSIYAAVEAGRVTFDNVRKATFFLISTGAAVLMTILTSLVLQWPLPFLPAQALWLNLVTNGLQDVALAFEPGEKGVLKRRPRPRNEGVISGLLWERTAFAGLVMAIGTLYLFQWELGRTDSLAQAQTVALTTMVIFQVFHVGNSRSEHESVFRRSPFSNPFLFIATIAAVTIHVAALYLAPTQFVLRVEPIDLNAWMRIVMVAATIIVAMELHKLLRRER